MVVYCQRRKQALDAGSLCQEFQGVGTKAKRLSKEKYCSPCMLLLEPPGRHPFHLPCITGLGTSCLDSALGSLQE